MLNDSKYPCGFCREFNNVKQYPTYSTLGEFFEIRECLECKAFFLAPYPTTKQLTSAYNDTYYGEEEKFDTTVERVLDYFRRQRAQRVKKYLGSCSNVLDVGCGNGRFLEALGKYGDYTLHGIELPGKAAERARKVKEINLKTGTLEPDDFEPESLDAVTLFHVFEHLIEPKETLRIISDIVIKNGIAVFSFPNIDSFQARVFKGRWLHLDPPRHLFFFKPQDFIHIMEKYGFQLVSRQDFSIEYNPFGFQQSLLNCLYKKRDILFESLKGNKVYIKEYSRINLALQQLFYKLSFPFFIGMDAIESLFGKGATVELIFRKKT